jgi:hypothetical protein
LRAARCTLDTSVQVRTRLRTRLFATEIYTCFRIQVQAVRSRLTLHLVYQESPCHEQTIRICDSTTPPIAKGVNSQLRKNNTPATQASMNSPMPKHQDEGTRRLTTYPKPPPAPTHPITPAQTPISPNPTASSHPPSSQLSVRTQFPPPPPSSTPQLNHPLPPMSHSSQPPLSFRAYADRLLRRHAAVQDIPPPTHPTQHTQTPAKPSSSCPTGKSQV